jgi:hypothetical protein
VKSTSLLPISFAVFVSAMVISPSEVSAQMIPSKAGLWADASEVIINGKKMPTIFDIKGMPAEALASQAAFMASVGLPKGWGLSLHCETELKVDLQKIFADLKDKGCTPTLTNQTSDNISGNLSCVNEFGSGAGTVSVQNINTNVVTYIADMKGSLYGQPMTYKATTISKYLGSDCQNLPKGLELSM